MLYEVESKAKISNVNDLRKKIKKIAKFTGKEKKVDEYFAVQKRGYPKKAFRIRKTGKKHLINFKKWIKKYWDSQVVVKEEYEFELLHLKEFLILMEDLGFKKWIKKIKISEDYNYKGDKKILIEINNVKHLGYFLEIEYLAKKNEIGKAKKKIKNVLKELGIKKSEINNTGYTKMLWRKGIRYK